MLRMSNRMFMSFVSRVPDVVSGEDAVHMKDFRIAMSGGDEETTKKIETMIEKGIFKPPVKDELVAALGTNPKQIADILKILVKEGRIVRINDSVYLSKKNAETMIGKVRDFFNGHEEMTVAEFRDILDTSRKYALPFLEYLDTQKVTLRVGEKRKLLKR